MTDLTRLTETELHQLATHLHWGCVVIKNDVLDFIARRDGYATAIQRGDVDGKQRGVYLHRIALIEDTLLILNETLAARRELLGSVEKALYFRGERHAIGMYSRGA